VKKGDTLSAIAAKYHTTWQALWKWNTTKGNRPASTIATLLGRGPNDLVVGEEIDIPQ
jgi:LysM repeat protein